MVTNKIRTIMDMNKIRENVCPCMRPTDIYFVILTNIKSISGCVLKEL